MEGGSNGEGQFCEQINSAELQTILDVHKAEYSLIEVNLQCEVLPEDVQFIDEIKMYCELKSNSNVVDVICDFLRREETCADVMEICSGPPKHIKGMRKVYKLKIENYNFCDRIRKQLKTNSRSLVLHLLLRLARKNWRALRKNGDLKVFFKAYDPNAHSLMK